jgi:hypothetical protein
VPELAHDDVLGAVERAVNDEFGHPPARASVSFVGVEPIEVLRYLDVRLGLVTLMTLGMSRRPMGDGDIGVDSPGPRAELIAQIRGDSGDLWRRLAVLAAAPVVEGVTYAEGMTVDLGVPLDESSRCTGGVIGLSPFAAINTGRGEVAILRFIPATPTELAYSRVRGSPALRELWEQAGTDLFDLGRAAVALD